jgi:hypothetical protein
MCQFVLSRVLPSESRETYERTITETSNIYREDVRIIVRLAGDHIRLRSCASQFGGQISLPSMCPLDRHPLHQHRKVWADLNRFVSRFANIDPGDTQLAVCLDHIKDVQRFGRLPRIYVDPTLSPTSDEPSADDAEVLYFDQAGADRFLSSKPNLEGKVLVVRDAQHSKTDVESFVKHHKQWPDRMFDVQDLKGKRGADNHVVSRKFSTIANDLLEQNRLDVHRPPINILNLAPTTHRPRPQCLAQDRFTLIDQLVAEARGHATDQVGKTTQSVTKNHPPRDFEDCLAFEIFGQAYCASLWHKDSSAVGTWVRCEFGLKLWPIVAHLSDKQRLDFKAFGEGWKPGPEEVPVVALFPGDTLIMFPENHNVHAPITMEDCHMTGGMFWDDKNVAVILENILNQISTERISNEDIPKQLRFIIQALLFRPFRLRRNDDDRVEDERLDYERVKNLCKSVLDKLSPCECGERCLAATGPSQCRCKAGGIDCTVACHPAKSTCKYRGIWPSAFMDPDGVAERPTDGHRSGTEMEID